MILYRGLPEVKYRPHNSVFSYVYFVSINRSPADHHVMIPLNLSRRCFSDASVQQSHPLNLSVKSESQSQSSSSEDGPSMQGIVGSMASQMDNGSLVEEETTAAFALCQLARSMVKDPSGSSRPTSYCDQTNTNSTKTSPESDSDECSASTSSVKHPKGKTRGTKRKRMSNLNDRNPRKRTLK